MANRKNRPSAAEATHVTAMRMVEAEQALGRKKTTRLRELRLAKEAEVDAPPAGIAGET
jgi:hypothetical protein